MTRKRPRRRRTSWDPLQIAVAVFLVTAVGNIHLLFTFLLPLRPTILGAMAAIGLYFVDKSRARRFAATWAAPTSRMIVAMLAWMTFWVPLALHRGVAYTSTIEFAKVVVLFLLIVGTVRAIDDLQRLILIYFLCTGINAFFATQGFHAGGGAWRMADVNGNWDANDFAVYCVTGIPLGIYFAQRYHSLLIRIGAVAILYFLVTSVVLSGSRGGFLALVATLAAVLTQFRVIKLKWRVGGAAVAVVVLLGAGSDRYWEQMRTILHPSDDYNLTSDGGRVEIWKRGVGYALQRPITGVGVQNFGVAEGFLMPRERQQLRESGMGMRWFAAHSAYIQVLAELGFPGIVFFLIAIGTAIAGLWKARKVHWAGDPRGAAIADAQTASLIGYIVGIVFLSHAYSEVLWSQLALAVATWKVAQLMRTASGRRGPRRGSQSRTRKLSALAR